MKNEKFNRPFNSSRYTPLCRIVALLILHAKSDGCDDKPRYE
jgi:hypothetical protein